MLLIEAGANINARDMDGTTPLYQAAKYDHAHVIALLLDAGADAGLDNEGVTPLGLIGRDSPL